MLRKYFYEYRYAVIIYMVMFSVSVLVHARVVLNVGPIFDAAKYERVDEVMRLFVVIFCGFVLFKLLEYFAGAVAIRTSNKMRLSMKRDLFSAMLGQDISKLYSEESGTYIAQLTNDITILENKGIDAAKALFNNTVTIFSVGGAIAFIDYRMGIVIAVSVILCILIPVMATKGTVWRMSRFLTGFDGYVQGLKNYFFAFRTVKNYGIENELTARFERETVDVETKKFDAEFRIEFINSLIGRIAFLTGTAVMAIGLVAVVYGRLSIGPVISAFLLAGDLGSPLQGIVSEYNKICSVKNIAKNPLYHTHSHKKKDKTAEPDKAAVVPDLSAPDIRLEHVSLSLGKNEILRDISFTFAFGKRYLILGGNGSGKSSLMRLLKGTFRKWQGEITYNGVPLRDIPEPELAKAVSYSNEMVPLFSDTIRSNVTLYRNFSEEEIKEAMELARLRLPLDRSVGDGGCLLSSGERRKLEIARALLSKPTVIIFDEVVSTLDIETAYEIEKLILSLQDRTVIAVSNAFCGELLGRYDEILFMDNGRIKASGSHEKLMETCPEYKELVELRCDVKGTIC